MAPVAVPFIAFAGHADARRLTSYFDDVVIPGFAGFAQRRIIAEIARPHRSLAAP
jgi:hypothetical protein